MARYEVQNSKGVVMSDAKTRKEALQLLSVVKFHAKNIREANRCKVIGFNSITGNWRSA